MCISWTHIFFTIDYRKYVLHLNWENVIFSFSFFFDGSNKSKKKIGIGQCLQLCSLPRLLTTGHKHLGDPLLDIWVRNVVPFMPDIELYMLNIPGSSSLLYSSLHGAPNALNWWNVWTEGRPVQHLDSSTMNPGNRYSLQFSTVFLNVQGLPWKRHCLNDHMLLWNLYIPFSFAGAFPDVQGANSAGTEAAPCHQWCRLLNWMLIKSWDGPFPL